EDGDVRLANPAVRGGLDVQLEAGRGRHLSHLHGEGDRAVTAGPPPRRLAASGAHEPAAWPVAWHGVCVLAFVHQFGIGPGRLTTRVEVLLKEVEAGFGAQVKAVDDGAGDRESLVVPAPAADGGSALLEVGDGAGLQVAGHGAATAPRTVTICTRPA